MCQDIYLILQTDSVIFIHLAPKIKDQHHVRNSISSYLGIILIATFSPVFLLTPFLTVAKLPLYKLYS